MCTHLSEKYFFLQKYEAMQGNFRVKKYIVADGTGRKSVIKTRKIIEITQFFLIIMHTTLAHELIKMGIEQIH